MSPLPSGSMGSGIRKQEIELKKLESDMSTYNRRVRGGVIKCLNEG